MTDFERKPMDDDSYWNFFSNKLGFEDAIKKIEYESVYYAD